MCSHIVPGRLMRKPITMRFDPDLLMQARHLAVRENRSLTNFIETAVRQRVIAASSEGPARAAITKELPKARYVAGQSR